jgi:hypothetical protein
MSERYNGRTLRQHIVDATRDKIHTLHCTASEAIEAALDDCHTLPEGTLGRRMSDYYRAASYDAIGRMIQEAGRGMPSIPAKGAIMITSDDLVNLLSTDRTPVPTLCQHFNLTRAALGAFIAAHRDELATAGAVLHVATHASAHNRLSTQVDGVWIAALSRPPRATGIVGQVVSLLDRASASIDEMRELRDRLTALIDAAAPSPARTTYHRQTVKGRAYWYAFSRDETGKQTKKYVGKVRPDTGEPA